jgi:hypothetical protein
MVCIKRGIVVVSFVEVFSWLGLLDVVYKFEPCYYILMGLFDWS